MAQANDLDNALSVLRSNVDTLIDSQAALEKSRTALTQAQQDFDSRTTTVADNVTQIQSSLDQVNLLASQLGLSVRIPVVPTPDPVNPAPAPEIPTTGS